MKNNYNLKTWQIILLTVGTLLMFGPAFWDFLVEIVKSIANINLKDIFTQEGMFFVGLFIVLLVGIYEMAKDFNDKPKSKYTK